MVVLEAHMCKSQCSRLFEGEMQTAAFKKPKFSAPHDQMEAF
jgi:hypothetical protein